MLYIHIVYERQGGAGGLLCRAQLLNKLKYDVIIMLLYRWQQIYWQLSIYWWQNITIGLLYSICLLTNGKDGNERNEIYTAISKELIKSYILVNGLAYVNFIIIRLPHSSSSFYACLQLQFPLVILINLRLHSVHQLFSSRSLLWSLPHH